MLLPPRLNWAWTVGVDGSDFASDDRTRHCWVWSWRKRLHDAAKTTAVAYCCSTAREDCATTRRRRCQMWLELWYYCTTVASFVSDDPRRPISVIDYWLPLPHSVYGHCHYLRQQHGLVVRTTTWQCRHQPSLSQHQKTGDDSCSTVNTCSVTTMALGYRYPLL
jgi:hypothetical protein